MSASRTNGQLLLEQIRKKYPGYHPLLSLADVAHDEDASLKLQADCHMTIAKYVEQQLKSVDVTANVSADFGTLRVKMIHPDDDEEEESGGQDEEE